MLVLLAMRDTAASVSVGDSVVAVAAGKARRKERLIELLMVS